MPTPRRSRELTDDRERRPRTGQEGRESGAHALQLRQMAEGHEQLYDALVRPVPGIPRLSAPRLAASAPGLASRPTGVRPLVSVIMPCFNHGRYLRDARWARRAGLPGRSR